MSGCLLGVREHVCVVCRVVSSATLLIAFQLVRSIEALFDPDVIDGECIWS